MIRRVGERCHTAREGQKTYVLIPAGFAARSRWLSGSDTTGKNLLNFSHPGGPGGHRYLHIFQAYVRLRSISVSMYSPFPLPIHDFADGTIRW